MMRAALVAVFLLAVGCGGITASAVGGDAADGPALEAAAAQDAGALELAADLTQSSHDGGELPPDMGSMGAIDALEAPPALPACPGTTTTNSYRERCRIYYPGRQCVAECSGNGGGQPKPGAPTCEAPGLPEYNGTLVCVASCSSCPP